MNKIFLTFSIYYFTAESNAYAYLDPVSGSVIIQYVVAGLVTCMVFMKNFWVKFKYFFNKKIKSKKNKKENSEI
jgi:hypothetical protein|tara:strand:+ start:169 stop:390 length:222 start_codon:yes stop_codon:yes gene_type:complete